MASVVALGMILSTLFLYIDYMRKPNYPDNSDSQNNLPDIEKQLQAEQENLELEAEQLAQYIEEYGPSEAVLMQLGAIYGALAEYAHVLDSEPGTGYLEKAAETYKSLVEMDPEQVGYRFMLYSTYKGLEQKEEAGQQAAVIKQLLEKKQAGGTLKNIDHFYYALILNEEDGNKQEALNHLSVVLEKEPEESSLHSQAKAYREQIESKE